MGTAGKLRLHGVKSGFVCQTSPQKAAHCLKNQLYNLRGKLFEKVSRRNKGQRGRKVQKFKEVRADAWGLY